MTDRKSQALIDSAIVAGIIAGALYPIAMLDLAPGRWSNLAFMLFGPFFAISAYGMRAFYARARDTATNDIACLLLILAGAAFTFMATMQMSIYTAIPGYHRASLEPDAATWDAILRGVSTTQLGLDFAFDIFVSFGVILLGWQMVLHPRVPALLGLAGIAIGAAGISVNTITFPENSGIAGLIDPAPVFGVWFGLAWLPLIFFRSWRPKKDPA